MSCQSDASAAPGPTGGEEGQRASGEPPSRSPTPSSSPVRFSTSSPVRSASARAEEDRKKGIISLKHMPALAAVSERDDLGDHALARVAPWAEFRERKGNGPDTSTLQRPTTAGAPKARCRNRASRRRAGSASAERRVGSRQRRFTHGCTAGLECRLNSATRSQVQSGGATARRGRKDRLRGSLPISRYGDGPEGARTRRQSVTTQSQGIAHRDSRDYLLDMFCGRGQDESSRVRRVGGRRSRRVWRSHHDPEKFPLAFCFEQVNQRPATEPWVTLAIDEVGAPSPVLERQGGVPGAQHARLYER